NRKGRTGTADRSNLFGPYRIRRPAANFWRTPWSYSTALFPNPSWEDDRCLTQHQILRGSSKCRRCHAGQRVDLTSKLAALVFADPSAQKGAASKPIAQQEQRTRP